MMNITDLGQSLYQVSGLNPQKVLEVVNRYTRECILALKLLSLKPWTLDIQRASFKMKDIKRDLHLLQKKGVLTVGSDGIRYKDLFYVWRLGEHIALFENPRGFKLEHVKGIPGWHNQCFTLIKRYLGTNFIHYGGIDLKAIHHANQMLLLNQFDNYRVIFHHSGVLIAKDKEKLSKSRGNVPFQIGQILEKKKIDRLRIYFENLSFKSNQEIEDKVVEQLTRVERVIDRRARKAPWGWVYKREKARRRGDYKTADMIREKLKQYNYKLRDLKNNKTLLIKG